MSSSRGREVTSKRSSSSSSAPPPKRGRRRAARGGHHHHHHHLSERTLAIASEDASRGAELIGADCWRLVCRFLTFREHFALAPVSRAMCRVALSPGAWKDRIDMSEMCARERERGEGSGAAVLMDSPLEQLDDAHVSNVLELLGLQPRALVLARTLITDASLAVLARAATSLRELNLSSCEHITDAGVRELRTLRELRVLDVAGCVLLTDAALEVLPALSHLERLDISHLPHVTDVGMRSVAQARSLRVLHMFSATNVTDAGVALLRALPLLDDLELSRCTKLTDDALRLCEALHLRKLDLRCLSAITDEGLAHLRGAADTLEELKLKCCPRLTDAGIEAARVGAMPLRVLALARNTQLSDRAIHQLSTAQHLRELDMRGLSRVTDAALASLAHVASLRTLNISGCAGITDAGVAHLRELRLETLNAEFVPELTDAAVEHLRDMRASLRHLCLAGDDRITGSSFVSVLRTFTVLETLDCSGLARLSSTAVEVLCDMETLRYLDLSDCANVDDETLDALSGCLRGLRSLQLSGNSNITEDGVAMICSLPLLHTLDISCCDGVSDAILPALRNAPSLRHVSFGRNFSAFSSSKK